MRARLHFLGLKLGASRKVKGAEREPICEQRNRPQRGRGNGSLVDSLVDGQAGRGVTVVGTLQVVYSEYYLSLPLPCFAPFLPPFSIGFGSISWGSLHTLCMSSYIIHPSPLATLRYYANLSFEVSGACLWDAGVHCPVKKSISDVLLPLCTRVLDHHPCNLIQSVCTRAWLFVGAF